MAVVGTFRSGKNGGVTYGSSPGVPLSQSKFSVKHKGMKISTTNFLNWTNDLGNAGVAGTGRCFTQGLVGTENLTFETSGHWNAQQEPGDPPIVTVTDDGDVLILFVNVVDASAYVLPVTLVLEVDVDVDVEGNIDYKFSGENNGDFGTPYSLD